MQYPVVVRDVQRPLVEIRVMDALVDERVDRLTASRPECADKVAAAQELRQALEAADLLVEEQREVPTFRRHAVGPQPDAEHVEAAQRLRQALEAAESVEDPEQWDQCSECGDQPSSLCRLVDALHAVK